MLLFYLSVYATMAMATSAKESALQRNVYYGDTVMWIWEDDDEHSLEFTMGESNENSISFNSSW